MAATPRPRKRGPVETGTCAVCGQTHPRAELHGYDAVRPGVSALIAADHPDWGPDGLICARDLARYRRDYVEDLLDQERGELSRLDREVLDSLATHSVIAADPEREIEERASFGERLADRVAEFGGSWTFILSFAVFLAIWMALNVLRLTGFDPYPFILLNLVLSCMAAVQAPIIMMSQRRQETKDRLRAENDYRVNLKAELEVRLLHEKIDHQMAVQWEKLAELQRIQIEAIAEQSQR